MEYALSLNSYPNLCSVYQTLFFFSYFLQTNNPWQPEVHVG